MSDTTSLKTFTGLTVDQMYDKLDEELPADAYKAILHSHGKDGQELTDIDPNYATEVLNKVFGPCGLGWGFTYNPADLSLTIEDRPRSDGKGTRRVCLAVLKQLTVWYKFFYPDGSEKVCNIDSGGASDNDDEAYAIKGAITYAIGNALSKIGWQKSVYLGKRSHRTVQRQKPSVPAKPTAAASSSKVNATPAAASKAPAASKPAAAPVANDGEISDEPPAKAAKAEAMSLENVLNFVVPTGNWKGRTFQDVEAAGETGLKAIDFWTRMSPGTDADKRSLKAVAQRYVELVKADHKVAQPA